MMMDYIQVMFSNECHRLKLDLGFSSLTLAVFLIQYVQKLIGMNILKFVAS